MGADASTAPLGSSKPKKQVPIFHQMLIVLHGSRKSGKTSLLRRMNGLNFQPQYTPTKCLQASEIIWHPICMPNEAIKIVVWDVVDKAIDPTPQSQRTKQLPDATNADTFSRADGIIIVYDPRDDESIKYARSILDQAPQSKPTLIVMNFADSFETVPSVPSLMEPYTNSFFHLTASMKTNQGLAELANWLDLPMNVSLSKIYELHLKQAEEKLVNLKTEFNLTGLDVDSEQSSQLKTKGNSKDFWANEPEDNKDDAFGVGSGEVPADFFMDDDESDLKAKQNLEKLKKKLNITEHEEEEESDEEMKLKMAKKKSKILSKTGSRNQTKEMSKPAQIQTQDEDENEYNTDDEYNNDNTDKPPPPPTLANISFDIPVVAENDNSFFEDDKIEDTNEKELDDDDSVNDKLEELKKKLNLEIPKEEEEEKEEKPKAKKSKILPKVKPPQIIVKPAQPHPKSEPPQLQPQQPEEAEVKPPASSAPEQIENKKEISQIDSQKIEIPVISDEKEKFFSDESENNEMNNENQNSIEDKIDFTLPSFGDENEDKENDIENTNQAEVTKQKDLIGQNENNDKIIEIKNDVDNSSNEASKINSTLQPNANSFSRITFPSFEDEDLPPNGNENQKEPSNVNMPTISDITFPSSGNDDFFGDADESDKNDQLNKDENEINHEQNKIEKKSKILPKKETSISQNKVDPSSISSESINNNKSDQTSEPISIPNVKINQDQFPEITFPSFDDNTGINENKTNSQEQITLPTFDVSFDDIKESNFFSDDDAKNENLQNEEKEENKGVDTVDEDSQKKKKSIILPKQNLHFASTVNSAIDDSSKTAEKENNETDIDSIDLAATLQDIQENTVSNDSFFTEKPISSSNSQDNLNMPPPPPIDFSNSFLSEKPKSTIPETTTNTTIASLDSNNISPLSNQNENIDSDLDIINAIRKQEAERAERARQNEALLQARNVSISENNQQQSSNTEAPVPSSQAAASAYTPMGDYEAFDDTPQTSTRERKHRKHGSSSHRSRRHKSGRKGKAEESDGQNEEAGGNDESYLSFD